MVFSHLEIGNLASENFDTVLFLFFFFFERKEDRIKR